MTMNHIAIPAHSLMNEADFIFGVATSSFQIEGARHSRETCIWDTFCDQPGSICDYSNGDRACEHLERWQDDVDIIASLGVDAYRLSVSWGRVINADGTVNRPGLDFYVELVNALNKRNIKVFLTLYHWDLPDWLEQQGGWLNRATAGAFAHYADVMSKALGHRVYAWATLNEPFCSAYLGYETGVHAPGLSRRHNGRLAGHHLLLAHGMAMRVLRRNCPAARHGIVLNFSTCFAASRHPDDIRAAQQADEYLFQWFLQPLLTGEYPAVLHCLAENEKPQIQPDDMALIRQPLDYLGVNYYSPTVYRSDGKGWFSEVPPRNVPVTDMGWEISPEAFTTLLVKLHQRYQLPPVYITENGAAMDDVLENGAVQDNDRTAYFHSHLNAVNTAMELGADIRGYFAWSLMDNFEWSFGYTKRFGLVYVDYASQQRIIKQSGLAYRQFLNDRRDR